MLVVIEGVIAAWFLIRILTGVEIVIRAVLDQKAYMKRKDNK